MSVVLTEREVVTLPEIEELLPVETPETPEVRVLREAYELLENRDHWCRHNAAVNERGTFVMPESSAAVAWCVAGAIWKVTPGPSDTLRHNAFMRLAESLGVTTDEIPEINDGPKGYERVMEGLRKTIDR